MNIEEKTTLQLLTALEWIGKNTKDEALVEHALRFQFVADNSGITPTIRWSAAEPLILRFNPWWVLELTFEERVSIILHEANHADARAKLVAGFKAGDYKLNDLFRRRGPTELSK